MFICFYILLVENTFLHLNEFPIGIWLYTDKFSHVYSTFTMYKIVVITFIKYFPENWKKWKTGPDPGLELCAKFASDEYYFYRSKLVGRIFSRKESGGYGNGLYNSDKTTNYQFLSLIPRFKTINNNNNEQQKSYQNQRTSI